MLSRTADNLYWLARYMERAQTAARLMEMGARIALLPNVGQGYRSEWDAVLRASGSAVPFAAKYGEANEANIQSHLFFDRDNPSSVASCITRARENGRIVRTALSMQVWDALNTAFQELRVLERTPPSELSLFQLTEWTARHAAMLRGSIDSTLLRNDGFDFLNIGFNLERVDNTARLLDVKYYVLLPRADFVGSGLDNYQWTTLLRALSAHRAFHWAYGGEVTASKIAHFLILNNQAPLSLITCVEELAHHLDRLATRYGRTTPAQDYAQDILTRLRGRSVDDVFDEGLHEFLTRVIRETSALAQLVHETYLSGDMR